MRNPILILLIVRSLFRRLRVSCLPASSCLRWQAGVPPLLSLSKDGGMAGLAGLIACCSLFINAAHAQNFPTYGRDSTTVDWQQAKGKYRDDIRPQALVTHPPSPVNLRTLSSNGEEFWQQTNGPYGGEIRAILSISRGNYLISVWGSIFRSTDGGNKWSKVFDEGYYLSALAKNPKGIIFAGGTGEVFRSTDNGINWTSTGLGGHGGVSLAIDSTSRIYAGIYGDGIFFSEDEGGIWQPCVSQPKSLFVYDICFRAPNSIFLATGGGIFMSSDRGLSWNLVGLPDTAVYTIAVDPSDNIFAGNFYGLYRSTDNGQTWVSSDVPYVISLAVQSSGIIFAGTWGNGVFASTDRGLTWFKVSQDTFDPHVTSLKLDADGTLFAGTYGGGVFRSTNYGNTWLHSSEGITLNPTLSLVANLNGYVFAGTRGGVFRQAPNASGWSLTPLSGGEILALAVGTQNVVFAGGANVSGPAGYARGIMKSTDNGATWTVVNNGLAYALVHALATNSIGHVYAGTYGGVFRSTDNGDTWTQINTGLTNTTVDALAVSGTNLFAGTDDGVFLSTNNGTSWTAVNTGLARARVRSLAVSGTNLFAGTYGGGVFRSTNNGTSWTAVNSGLTNTYVGSLAIISGTNLFAGTYGGGVFRSTNNGTSWTAVNSGLTNTYVWSLALNSDGYLFAGSFPGGVFRSVESTITPTMPTLSSPSNGATNQPTMLTLSWNAVSGASTYRLQVSTNQNFTPTVFDDSTVTTTSRQVGPLANNTVYYWRVNATNAGGTSPYSSTSSFTTLGARTVTSPGISFPANPTSSIDYRLVSFPGTTSLRVSDVLSGSGSQNTDWRIFRENGSATPNNLSELSSSSSFNIGESYWLLKKGTFNFSRSVTMPPLSSDGTYTINVRNGWNIIGNPFDVDLQWSAVLIANGLSNITLSAYNGSQGFQSVIVLASFKGYYCNLPVTSLKIPYPFPALIISPVEPPPIDWQLRLTLETDINKDEENYVGIAPSAKPDLDELDQPKPPLVFDQGFLYFPRPAWNQEYRFYNSDYRPGLGAGQVWEFEVSNPRRTKSVVRVMGIEAVPAEYDIMLTNLHNTGAVDLRKKNEYEFLPASERTPFQLIVGKRSFTEQELSKFIPSAFELEQNYPNPFNPATSIGYKVAKESFVKVEILSVLGQTVATLAHGRHSPGVYTVAWNATDRGGAKAPSGVYLSRLIVDGGVVQVRKMILLK